MNQGNEIFSEPSYLMDANLNWFSEESKKTKWSLEENKKIENALALYDIDTPDRWYKVASMIPGKTVSDVIKRYRELEEDVSDIEAGLIPVTSHTCDSFTLDWMDHQSFNRMKEIHVPGGERSTLTRPSDQERKDGVAWTEDEHRRFLLGLNKCGKGDWGNISRNFVISRTPTQVASHAQKCIIRQISGGNKRRSSIHDITTVNLIDAKFASINREIVEIEDDPLLLDHSHQLPVGEDAIHHKGILFGAEKENSSICKEETSEGKKPEKGISYEILSEHFGKPLADAAESFHVSRSTFKRMCRDHGITRWKYSKRRMGSHSSSKHRTVNDDDELSMNSSLMVIPPLQDTAVVALSHTSQDMNKINVKATYKGTAIRFELRDSSGITELEDMVIERLKLNRHTFSIKYQDDEGDWVLIACDNDVQKCIEISRSLKTNITKMLVDPPISS